MRLFVFLFRVWVGLLAVSSPWVRAYVLDDKLWTNATVTMQLQLDPTPLGRTLIDGSTSWNQVAEVAFSEWNASMQRMQFAVVPNSSAAIGRPNNLNNVFFSNTVYGDSWGSGVIAVAITYTTSTRRTESDVLFNSNRSWDSYRGNLRSALDLKRVALHEFGHVVGLDHPDQFGQSVVAVMNSIISNQDSLSADDRAGAAAGYGAPSGGGGTAPTIVAVNFSPTATVGATVQFTVSVTGTSPFTYQWFKNTVAIPGATGVTLTLLNVQTSDSGNYTVTVTNSVSSATSTPATLTVTSTTPVVLTQPANQTVTVGGSASFSVTASGNGTLTYQWYRNLVLIPGATASTLSLTNIQLSQAGSYTVVVSNGGGSTTSNAATLTVNNPPTAPVIVTHPSNQSASVGGSVSLSVVATGSAPLSYQWYRDGVVIPGATSSTLLLTNLTPSDAGGYTVLVTNPVNSVSSNTATLTVLAVPVAPSISSAPVSRTVLAGTAVTFSVIASGSPPLTFVWRRNDVVIPGANSATLNLPSVQVGDAGSYTVTVSNAVGSVTSPPAVLTVTVPATAPSITVPPASQTVLSGTGVTFTVTATGTTPLSYQWLKNGQPLAGATNPSLVISAVQPSDAGNYSVTVSNAGGSVTSGAAVLTVTLPPTVPVIVTPPSSQSVTVGSSATFSVTANGTAPLSYQWRQGGANITNATQSTFVIGSVQLTDGGNYSVVVSNSLGSVTSTPATLTVLIPASAPVILTQPSSQAVTVGGSVTLTVLASGTQPLSYQWRKAGVAIPGATGSSLVLHPVLATDAAVYSVVVSNSVGSVTSAGATLTVNPAPVAPTLVTPPVGSVATAGSPVSFSVVAGGTAPLSYQWFRGGVAVAGATQATLLIPSVQDIHAGPYTVTVTNVAGSVSSLPVTLVVLPPVLPPAIAAAPLPQSVAVGGTATFTVTVTGSAPFTYQWLRNGSAVAADDGVRVSHLTLGATTETLTLSQVQPGDAGDYAVVVSNAAGSVTSAAATLTVTPALGSRISNVSIRTTLAASQPLIVGLSMAGGSKPVLVRAVGPGLAAFGVTNAMPDPELALFGSSSLLAANDDWGGAPDLTAAFAAVGAFSLAPGSLDAALLGPVDGGRTAQVSGPSGGNVLVEAYDAGTGNSPRLVNVSARNRVGTAGEVLIAGFTLTGNTSKTVLIRAVGPTLGSFGVPGVLSDPKVEVFSGQTKVDENDNWPSALASTFTSVGAFGLTAGSKDAALLLTLPPGGYTVQVSGVGGASGEALIELYEVPSP